MRICKACNDYKMGGVVQEAQNIIYGLFNASHAIQSSFNIYELYLNMLCKSCRELAALLE